MNDLTQQEIRGWASWTSKNGLILKNALDPEFEEWKKLVKFIKNSHGLFGLFGLSIVNFRFTMVCKTSNISIEIGFSFNFTFVMTNRITDCTCQAKKIYLWLLHLWKFSTWSFWKNIIFNHWKFHLTASCRLDLWNLCFSGLPIYAVSILDLQIAAKLS